MRRSRSLAGRGRTGWTEASDEQLVEFAQVAPDAFGEFYDRHVTKVFLYHRSRSNDTQDALDLTAETFEAALRSLRSYDPEIGVPAAWLFGIAKNRYRRSQEAQAAEARRLEREKLFVVTLSPDDLARIDELADIEASMHDVEEQLEELPTGTRRAVELRYLDDRSVAQVAHDLQIEEWAARKRIARGVRLLRDRAVRNPFKAEP